MENPGPNGFLPDKSRLLLLPSMAAKAPRVALGAKFVQIPLLHSRGREIPSPNLTGSNGDPTRRPSKGKTGLPNKAKNSASEVRNRCYTSTHDTTDQKISTDSCPRPTRA